MMSLGNWIVLAPFPSLQAAGFVVAVFKLRAIKIAQSVDSLSKCFLYKQQRPHIQAPPRTQIKSGYGGTSLKSQCCGDRNSKTCGAQGPNKARLCETLSQKQGGWCLRRNNTQGYLLVSRQRSMHPLPHTSFYKPHARTRIHTHT